jgi:hypothetical protein
VYGFFKFLLGLFEYDGATTGEETVVAGLQRMKAALYIVGILKGESLCIAKHVAK